MREAMREDGLQRCYMIATIMGYSNFLDNSWNSAS